MKEYKLQDLLEIKNGKDYKNYKLGKIPVYGTGGVITSINEYLYDKESVLLPRKGSLSNITYVNRPFWTVDTMYWSIINKNKVYPKYLYFYLKLMDLSSKDSGSTLPSMTFDAYYGISLRLPDLYTQSKSLELLNSIDRKIEINNQINDNLELQIKTIFSFLFLQNANFKWEVKSLTELSKMYQPQTISRKTLVIDGNYFVYGANGIIGKYDKYNHNESEIAVACRGSCGFVQMTLPFSWITGNSMVIKPNSDFPYKEYLYYYLLAKNPNYLCSGSVQPQLTRENLALYTIPVPPKSDLNIFENYAKKARKIIIKNKQENITLSSLRDYLLPLLMIGQATIDE